MQFRTVRSTSLAALALGTIALAAACRDVAPLAPSNEFPIHFNSEGTPGSKVTLCKLGAPGTFVTTLGQGGTGTLAFPGSFVVDAGQCVTVWTGRLIGADDPCCEPLDGITITETSAIPTQIQVTEGNCNVAELTANGITVEANTYIPCTVTFTNAPPPPPPGDGCTPGFWKNSPGSWPPTGYLPNQNFDAVFGVTAFGPHVTLIAAAGLGSGGANALARHAVAALLNSSHPDLTYEMDAAAVIAAVQGAFASGSFETVKNQLAALNERSCPLDNDNSF